MIYILLLAVIILAPRIRIKRHRNESKLDKERRERINYCCLLTVMFVILLFLKHDYVGTDTQNYRRSFELVNFIKKPPDTITLSTEIGYWFLQLCMGSLGVSFRIMMLFCAVFYVGTISVLIYKYSEMPWLSYFLFLTMGYFIFFTTTRQALALGFTIWSFMMWQSGKKMTALLFTAIACSFHTSAIVFWMFYFIQKIRWSYTKFILAILIFGVNLIFANKIMIVLLRILDENYEQMQTGGYLLMTLYFAVVVVAMLYHKNYIAKTQELNIFIGMMVGTLLLLPFGKFNPFFFRLIHYFAVYIIVFVPNFIKGIRDKHLIGIMLLCFLCYGVLSFMNSNSGVRTMPYVFYWEEYPQEKLPAGLAPAGRW